MQTFTASQDYHDTIMSALNGCKAAVVIWFPQRFEVAVGSR